MELKICDDKIERVFETKILVVVIDDTVYNMETC